MPNAMTPQSHDPLAAPTDRVQCIVLTSPGLERIVTRRLSTSQRGGLPWRFRIVHDPMLALAELAVIERATVAEEEAISSRLSALGDSEGAEPTAASRQPTGASTIFIYALPSLGKSRELFETIKQHMPRVHAISFDEHGLRLLEQNAAMFVQSVEAIGHWPSTIGDSESNEPSVDSRQPRAVSISREEIDMLLDPPDDRAFELTCERESVHQ